MRRTLPIAATFLLIAALTGCTNTTGSDGDGNGGPANVEPNTATPTQSPIPTLTPMTGPVTQTPAPSPANHSLASLTYKSGQTAPSLKFTVPAKGYRLNYTCHLDKTTPQNQLPVITTYDEVTPGQTSPTSGQLICDNSAHIIAVNAAQVATEANAGKTATITLTGDRMWVTDINLVVTDF